MKKYFLAASLVILLSLKITSAIDFDLKPKIIKIKHQNQIKEFSSKEIEIVKIDYGFFKNITSNKYTIKKESEKKILNSFKISSDAINAKFNKNTNTIVSAKDGFEIGNKIFEIEKINLLELKAIPAKVSNKDAIAQKTMFQELIQQKIKINEDESEIKVDPKWIDLESAGAKINIEKTKNGIESILNKGKNTEIRIAKSNESFTLNNKLEMIEKIKSIQINGTINVKTEQSYPKITNENNENINVISVGRSNFEGSIPNRIYNVKEGAKVFNNIIIKPNEQFSYNYTLSTKGADVIWKNAYIIVNGKDLKLSPGGGLCQTSTTIFRAALKAGLDINQWKNHSIYVSYYSQYGDGIDSTIYPGKQDLVFTNTYKNDLYLISEVDDNNNMYTFILGKDKPKEVNFNGPFYGKKQDKMENSNYSLRSNQIGWEREINGEIQEFISTYNTGVKLPENIERASKL